MDNPHLTKEQIEAQKDRATGKTTRLADCIIQALFSGSEVLVLDHVDHHISHRCLAERVIRRVEAEHPSLSPYLEFSRARNTLRFNNKGLELLRRIW